MFTRRFKCILFLVVATAAAAALAEPSISDIERWSVITIDGRAVGSVHETRSVADDKIHFEEYTYVALNRMGTKVEVISRVQTVETISGALQAFRMVQQMSEQEVSMHARQRDGQWVMTQEVGDQQFEQPMTTEHELIGPMAALRRIDAELKDPGDATVYHSLSPMTGQPARFVARMTGLEAQGGEVLRVIEERIDVVPMTMVRRLNRDGVYVTTSMPGPFGETRIVLADQIAAELANQGGELPEESYHATLLEVGYRLPQARDIEYLELELTHRNPGLGWPDFGSTSQQVLEQDDERLVLAISRRHPNPNQSAPGAAEGGIETYLQANAWLQSDGDEVRSLAAEIIGEESDDWRASQKLERWVAENMVFDMGVVMAPSSEVLRNRRGTCTEYAVLLSTLARAAGIPSRYVMGYIYVHGIFGGHAWAEVLIDDQWIALDGAIPSQGAADAARFAFQWSSLNDGAAEFNAGPAVQLFGQINARVRAYRVAGQQTVELDAGQAAISVDDSQFVDHGLGVSWQAPAGMRFVDYDRTWPDNLVVALTDDNGLRVELRELTRHWWQDDQAFVEGIVEQRVGNAETVVMRINGHPVQLRHAGDRAAMVLETGQGSWLVAARGLGSAQSPQALVDGLHFLTRE